MHLQSATVKRDKWFRDGALKEPESMPKPVLMGHSGAGRGAAECPLELVAGGLGAFVLALSRWSGVRRSGSPAHTRTSRCACRETL